MRKVSRNHRRHWVIFHDADSTKKLPGVESNHRSQSSKDCVLINKGYPAVSPTRFELVLRVSQTLVRSNTLQGRSNRGSRSRTDALWSQATRVNRFPIPRLPRVGVEPITDLVKSQACAITPTRHTIFLTSRKWSSSLPWCCPMIASLRRRRCASGTQAKVVHRRVARRSAAYKTAALTAELVDQRSSRVTIPSIQNTNLAHCRCAT